MPTGISETRVYNDVLTTTLASMPNKFEDNVFDVTPLLSWMNGKLGREMRGPQNATVKKLHGGSESIVKDIMVNKNLTVSSYSGAGVIDTHNSGSRDDCPIPVEELRRNHRYYRAKTGVRIPVPSRWSIC